MIKVPDEYNKKYMAWVGKTELNFTVSELRKAGVEVLTHKDKIFPEDRKKTLFSWGANVGDNAYFRAFDWKVFEEDEDEEIRFTIDLYGKWPSSGKAEIKKVIMERLGLIEPGVERSMTSHPVTHKFELSAALGRVKDDCDIIKKNLLEMIKSCEFEISSNLSSNIIVCGTPILVMRDHEGEAMFVIKLSEGEDYCCGGSFSKEEVGMLNEAIEKIKNKESK